MGVFVWGLNQPEPVSVDFFARYKVVSVQGASNDEFFVLTG